MQTYITDYIAFRYPNWMDYARHHCRVQHLEGWEADLMDDMIVDLLRKPEDKLADLMSRPTRKIVNGRPTTELDKFVLAMIKMNACSRFAAFRKNTVGQKIISNNNNTVEVATFTELTAATDCPDECTYNTEHAAKLDRMHRRNMEALKLYGYSVEVCELYRRHFMSAEKPTTQRQKMIIEQITDFLTNNKYYATQSDKNYSLKH